MIELKDFQQSAVENLEKMFLTKSRALLQSPTGSGKTVIASKFISNFVIKNTKNKKKKPKILFIVNRQSLIGQVYSMLQEFNVSSSVLHNQLTKTIDNVEFDRDYGNNVIITMPETFHINMNVLSRRFNPDYIVFDEAHKATSESFQEIVELYPNARILGLTATPARAKNKEGESLREWYGEDIITTCTIKELIEKGILVQPIYFNMTDNDHVVNTWINLTKDQNNKRTIIFTQDTKHSIRILEAFKMNNINAEIITSVDDAENDVMSQTPNKRAAILKDYKDGKIDVLVSVNALCEGFDERQARYCFLLRNVGNPALYHQMVGAFFDPFLKRMIAL